MEIECSKCHRRFNVTNEGSEICPDCLRNEFATVAPSLDASERAELAAEYHDSLKRQAARAEMMGGVYASGRAFSVAGKLRLSLGIGVFLICGFLFLISDKESGVTFLANLDADSQRIISMILCVVSAVLVASAGLRYRKTLFVIAAVILVSGWYFPVLLQLAQSKSPASAEEATADKVKTPEKVMANEESTGGPLLTRADLDVYYSLKSSSQRLSHYAVFFDNQDARSRSLMREALNRLLEAEYTRAYTRANGALYVVANVRGSRKNISQLLSRFGRVVHADTAEGIYEVRFDPDKSNLVSQYSPDILSSPLNTSFVSANLSELRCVDPMRVRMAASSLARANVRVLRREVRDTLVEVLRDPWATVPDTYSELIEALVTYSPEQDKEAVSHAMKYFEARRVLNREVSPQVTMYLIREVPDQMVNPILDFWCENPIHWAEMLNQLGSRVQAPLLERLSATSNIRLITTMLKYLEDRGTAEALPVVEKFLDYPDTIIRHSAQATCEAIKSR